MKSREKLYKKLRKRLKYLTSFEKTRVLVEIDRIMTTPYRDHRVELLFYRVRYNALNKCIYIYEKREKDSIVDEHEYLTDDDTGFEGYKYKIPLETRLKI